LIIRGEYSLEQIGELRKPPHGKTRNRRDNRNGTIRGEGHPVECKNNYFRMLKSGRVQLRVGGRR
jgi:hypothetical protein